MFKVPLNSEDTFLILAPRWADLGPTWQMALLALILVAPVALVLSLYRYELWLIQRRHALGLLSLRMLVLFVLWIVVGLQPHLANERVEETPGRVRVAVDLSASMDVTDRPGSLSRKQVIANILGSDGMNLIQRLAERHQVEIIGFHQQTAELSAAHLFEHLADTKSKQETFGTDLHQPLLKLTSSREQPLLGILLFGDGQHNVGAAPLSRADELGKQRLPIFPVVIGPREPPSDVMILDVQAPTKVFKNLTLPVEIRCKVTNMSAQDMTVELQFEGKPVLPEHRQTIAHKGKDDVYSVRFQAKMEHAGTHGLTVKATSKGNQEITLANNTVSRVVRVAEDKAKVLLVDGDARWEYHYLANALLRDPTIALERVVFSQPRIGLLKDDQLDKAGLPKSKLPEPKAESKDADPLLDYDCILLGDVAPEQLPIGDRRRLERYVSERGGTLILVAGNRHLPLAYMKADNVEGDPLAKMLPITEPMEWRKDNGFALRVTSEGKLRPFLNLNDEPGSDAWAELPKHFWGIVGKRKPAASVLLAPSPGPAVTNKGEENDTGILVQQNYGFGRVLFVGLDSTWRWRFRVGDTYHHRFWGQLARWSAAEKLLPAGNRHLRYGSREPVYTDGQEVDLAVRLSETLPPLKGPSPARAKLHRKNADGTEELIAVVPLLAHPRQPNLLEAKVRDLAQGTYRMELDIPQYREQIAAPSDDKDAAVKGRDLFRILPREQKELLDLSTNWSLMQSLAERSDGKLYTPETVEEIVERLARRIERKETRDETKPWQNAPMVWWFFGILLGLLTLEWVWRKLVELP
ncbi:MAG: VWA domain-containing protein [Gemmataceae bacterium]|nr:VWA domain-containing protein [Gemmataceae bacterium]